MKHYLAVSALVAVMLGVALAAPDANIGNWGQCGGMGGNCWEYGENGVACQDAPYPAPYKCATEGWSCQRQQGYYWQCLEGESPVIPDGSVKLGLWQQCGGMGGFCYNTPYAICTDGAWPNTACESGFCNKQNEWYYQCEPSAPQPVTPGDNGSGNVVPGTKVDLAEYAQCGGIGGVCGQDGHPCIDAKYPDVECIGESVCRRQNAYYWQCIFENGGGVVPPVVPDVAPIELPRYLQCGGIGGNCTMPGYTCGDAPYPGHVCTAGTACVRQTEYYHQCL